MKLLNAEEVAYILSIPVSSAYEVMKKELTPIKIGARLRVDAEEVHTYHPREEEGRPCEEQGGFNPVRDEKEGAAWQSVSPCNLTTGKAEVATRSGRWR